MITGIDEEKDNIFDQRKRAMKKYLGSVREGISAKKILKLTLFGLGFCQPRKTRGPFWPPPNFAISSQKTMKLVRVYYE